MPGPLPKDERIRQRRNKPASRAVLQVIDAPRNQAPALPGDDGMVWHPMACDWWNAVWESPMHIEFLRGDEPSLLRLLLLVDLFWKVLDVDDKLKFAREIRMLEREFGLTPLSRRRLEWSVVQAENAMEQHARRRKPARVIEDVDPREVLE